MTDTEQISEPIAHPLDRLRGLIRRYVLTDGLLTAALFALLWFWIGLALDYGLFKATHFDWVLDAPKLLRIVAFAALAALLAGILVTRLWLRLHREISYPSLALVLEKRFPKILGDRLITAVELADVEKAKKAGYSEGMLRDTIEQAREAVKQVPVASVFNWKRLRTKGLLLALAAVGILAAVFAGYGLISGSFAPGGFAARFGDVAGIWAERNLLLRNTPWPRAAHLEFVNFPDSGELRVGKDASAPKVSLRAYKWVVADRGNPHGWRPMLWGDAYKFLGMSAPPQFEVEGGDTRELEAVNRRDMDGMETQFGNRPSFASIFKKLNAAAADAGNSRSLRKLEIPGEVVLSYSGPKSSGKVSLTREANNVFTGEVSGLKESVRFTVKGSDFATLPRSITLVPPPMFTRLTRTEYQPAYLYHPPPQTDGPPDFAALKGLRQTLAEKDLSLTGDKSVFSIVQGTEFEIAGTADKRLSKVQLKPKIGPLPGQTKPTDVVELPVLGDDRDGFRAAFRGKDRPTANLEFDLVLTDEDGVTTTRQMLVQVVEDQAPTVDLAVDILRKQGNYYLVTPVAMVPFLTESKVRDDLALGKVEFTYTVSQVEAAVVLAVQAQALAGIFADMPLAPNISNVYMPAASAVFTQSLTKAESREAGAVLVSRYRDQFAGLRRDTLEGLKARLGAPLDADAAQIIREVKFQDQANDVFDLRLALPKLSAGADAGESGQRYRVELTLLATDANVETGPKTGTSLEPIRLLVISEADLLTEISRDEETQAGRLDEALKKLRDTQVKLNQMADRLVSPSPDVIVSSAVRAQDIAQDVAKSREITAGVFIEYKRIYREAEFNRIRPETLNRWLTEIIRPLDAIIEKTFAESEQAHAQVQLALGENRKPDEAVLNADRFALAKLIAELDALRQKLGEAVSLNKLRNELTALRDRQIEIGKLLKRFKQKLIDQLYQPELVAGPVIELNKGETKTVKQGINWRVYTGGPIAVKLEGPGADKLKLPESVKVSDDREDFEYAITAGQTPGEYRITLTPTVGAPLIVTVKIR